MSVRVTPSGDIEVRIGHGYDFDEEVFDADEAEQVARELLEAAAKSRALKQRAENRDPLPSEERNETRFLRSDIVKAAEMWRTEPSSFRLGCVE